MIKRIFSLKITHFMSRRPQAALRAYTGVGTGTLSRVPQKRLCRLFSFFRVSSLISVQVLQFVVREERMQEW
jgi:hypothetical protein